MNKGEERPALNIGVLIVPLFFLLLLRRWLLRNREAVRLKSSS
jgi:hypothetical protein